MKINENSLVRTTFATEAKARWQIEYDDIEDLKKLVADEYFQTLNFFHMGQGSNLLFTMNYPGAIIHSNIKGIEVYQHTENETILRIGAAEIWDDVVQYAVDHSLSGIENLSLIPGEVGAAAVQNIGAYGAEIAQVVEAVETFDIDYAKKRIFSNAECKYGYRESFFKQANNDGYFVTHVRLKLKNRFTPNLSYKALQDLFPNPKRADIRQIRDTIIGMRTNKLPNPDTHPNAGSFFKNPIVSPKKFEELRSLYPGIPHFTAEGGRVKIPAAWLIEMIGFKGIREGNVGCFKNQPLVLVNYGGATGREIAKFAQKIMDKVNEKFDIKLSPEVLYV